MQSHHPPAEDSSELHGPEDAIQPGQVNPVLDMKEVEVEEEP